MKISAGANGAIRSHVFITEIGRIKTSHTDVDNTMPRVDLCDISTGRSMYDSATTCHTNDEQNRLNDAQVRKGDQEGCPR